jgi:hypothetical protein
VAEEMAVDFRAVAAARTGREEAPQDVEMAAEATDSEAVDSPELEALVVAGLEVAESGEATGVAGSEVVPEMEAVVMAAAEAMPVGRAD